jgi:hypothetical protein
LRKPIFLHSQCCKPRHSRARGFLFLRLTVSQTLLVAATDDDRMSLSYCGI